MAKLDRLSSSDAANAFNTLARTADATRISAREMAASLHQISISAVNLRKEDFCDNTVFTSASVYGLMDGNASVYRLMDTKPRRLRCEYCGCLSEKDYGTCEHCGAPL